MSEIFVSLINLKIFSDWIESGMESDVAPDEMYLMLQADMVRDFSLIPFYHIP